VLNSLGAVALAEKKDNAGAAKYFALALKEGSEEPTTFMNLATALVNLGRRGRRLNKCWNAAWLRIPITGN